MIPELPFDIDLDCELKVRALKADGLKDPQKLLSLTVDLVRQVYTLEHALIKALGRICDLQSSLDFATRRDGPPPIDQRFYEMANDILNASNIDMP